MRQLCISLLTILALASGAAAQDCVLGAYGDAAGTLSLVGYPPDGSGNLEFTFHVVGFLPDNASGAAYAVSLDGLDLLGSAVFVTGRSIGPSGDGLYIDEETGTNVALTECVSGWGGNPVLLESYTVLIIGYTASGGSVSVSANTNQDPQFPVYVTCSGVKKPCQPGPDFYVAEIFPVEETSFSRVKSLYD